VCERERERRGGEEEREREDQKRKEQREKGNLPQGEIINTDASSRVKFKSKSKIQSKYTGKHSREPVP
jgi:hypothetical protein